jgi:hypothetical protein
MTSIDFGFKGEPEMPRFFFSVHQDGVLAVDAEGSDLPTLKEQGEKLR